MQKKLKRRFSKHEKIILTGSKECTDGVHGVFFLDNAIYGLCRSFGRRFIKKNIERTDGVGFGESNKVKKDNLNKYWTFYGKIRQILSDFIYNLN